jgi:hypothetical protein
MPAITTAHPRTPARQGATPAAYLRGKAKDAHGWTPGDAQCKAARRKTTRLVAEPLLEETGSR